MDQPDARITHIPSPLDLPGRGITPAQAWETLMAGNLRQTSGNPQHPRRNQEARDAQISEERPLAAIFTCSDSRIPVEIIFDVGYGDLFSVRTAGPTVGDNAVASLEFAVVKLRIPLLLVLTHGNCGALSVARDQASIGPEDHTDLPGTLPQLVAGIRRSVALSDPAVAPELHARDLVEKLLASSAPIREAQEAGTLAVVPSIYNMATRAVTPVGDFPR